MSKQIRTIGYRNGIFIGQSNQIDGQNPQAAGIGICIDDMFLTCLSYWFSQSKDSPARPKGPTLLLYPHRQIFYSQQFPSNNKLKGFWSYLVPNFQIFGNNQQGSVAIVHYNGETITKLSLNNQKEDDYEQVDYKNQQQKWNKIEQIIGVKINQYQKSVQKFIHESFEKRLAEQQKFQNFVNIKTKNYQQYGITHNNQGILFNFKKLPPKISLSSLGYFKSIQPNKNLSFGRKFYQQNNSTSYQIQQGNFDKDQTYTFQFSQRRPAQSYKTSRKYFRQATSFSNKFLQISQADQVYKKLSQICKDYINKIALRYGQKIIQGSDRKIIQRQLEQEQFKQSNRIEKYNDSENYINRQYNLEQARAKIQSEINKKKTLGAFTNTATFMNRLQPVKGQKTTRQAKQSAKDKQPFYSSIYKQFQQTSRNRKSPSRGSPKKYVYTEMEDQEIPNEQRKRQKNQPLNSVYKNSEIRQKRQAYEPSYNYRPAVKQFTLYPVQNQKQRQRQEQMERQIRRKAIQRQALMKELNRDREAARYRVFQTTKAQKQRQKQKQNERYFQTQSDGYNPTYRRPIILLPTISPIKYSNTLQQANLQVGVRSTVNNSGHESYRRKYFPKVNYTQQPQISSNKASMSPISTKYNVSSTNTVTSRAANKNTHSPMTRLNNVDSRSKSPMDSKMPTKRKYNYMD